MTSLPFIVCWRKHIFSIIIQIFTEKHFSSKFWTAGPWTWLTLHFLAFWEIYILITHWWPISIPKTSNGVEWCYMTHFFWSWWKTAMSAKKSHKKWSSIILENRNIIAFQWGVIQTNWTAHSNVGRRKTLPGMEILRNY